MFKQRQMDPVSFILGKMKECGSVEYTLFGGWGQKREHTIRFELGDSALNGVQIISVKEYLRRISISKSILHKYHTIHHPTGWNEVQKLSGTQIPPLLGGGIVTGTMNIYEIMEQNKFGVSPTLKTSSNEYLDQLQFPLVTEMLTLEKEGMIIFHLIVDHSRVVQIIQVLTEQTQFDPNKVLCS